MAVTDSTRKPPSTGMSRTSEPLVASGESPTALQKQAPSKPLQARLTRVVALRRPNQRLVLVVPAHHLVEDLDPGGVAGPRAEDDLGREAGRHLGELHVVLGLLPLQQHLGRRKEELLERAARLDAAQRRLLELADGAVVGAGAALGRHRRDDLGARADEVGDEPGEIRLGDELGLHRMNSCLSSVLKAPMGAGTFGSSLTRYPNRS
ncbi:MAG: hypothetical protein QM765_16015 [Myxococcales bacterium]